VHKKLNILDKMPKSVQGKAKQLIKKCTCLQPRTQMLIGASETDERSSSRASSRKIAAFVGARIERMEVLAGGVVGDYRLHPTLKQELS
jgi:hypothetical protein